MRKSEKRVILKTFSRHYDHLPRVKLLALLRQRGMGGRLERCFFPFKHKAQIYKSGGYRMKTTVIRVHIVTKYRKSRTSLLSHLNICQQLAGKNLRKSRHLEERQPNPNPKTPHLKPAGRQWYSFPPSPRPIPITGSVFSLEMKEKRPGSYTASAKREKQTNS